MKTLVREEYGRDHRLVRCVHALALPGNPLYDRTGGMRKIVNRACEEAKMLEEAGFHALLPITGAVEILQPISAVAKGA